MYKYILLLTICFMPLNLLSRDCLDKSWQQYKSQEYKNAIVSINSCIDEIIADGNPKEMDYAFFGLANNFIKIGEVDSALKYILIAHDIEKKNNLEQSKTLNELGTIYIEKGLNHQAIYYLKKALNINKKNGNVSGIKINLSNIGISYTNLEMKDSATAYLNSALIIMNSNSKKSPKLLNNIAYSFYQNKEFAKSLEYLEESNNILDSRTSKLDKLVIITNLELVKVFNNRDYDNSIFDEYYEYTKLNENTFYFADANYKMAVIKSISKGIEVGLPFLNEANSIYVELGNIHKAKEITNTFLTANSMVNSSKFKYSENELSELLNIEYSKQLEKDLEARIASDSYIENIEEELFYAEVSYYLALSILFSLLLTIGFTIYSVRKNRHLNMLMKVNNNYFSLVEQLDSNRLKMNLSKIVNYMVLDKSFENKTMFTGLVDEVVNDTNKIRRTVKNGIDYQQTKRLNNV